MTDPEEDFATMFEASTRAKRFSRGQTIEGTIVAIGPEVAFVNVGGKGEALIEIGELTDADGVLEVAVGERIQATVVSTEGGLTLSRKLARSAATIRRIEDAFRSGLAVEGKIDREVKGGYDVRIGGQRAFCPFSQIDTARTTDPAQHLGRVYTFRIIEYKEGGKNIVVSRRALIEEEQRAGAVEVRRSIVAGAVLTGRVASVREFGAFVELGSGVQGLLHVSEMAWSRVSDTSQVLSPGQEITVKVLRVDEDGQKISLGLKQLLADPWSTVHATYGVGQVRAGRVTRLADFGAFVELEPGIEGLAHASTFAQTGRADSWRQTVTVGMTGAFEIRSIDPEKKRIGVALVPEGSIPEAEELRDYAARAESDSSGGFGSLADKLKGALKPGGLLVVLAAASIWAACSGPPAPAPASQAPAVETTSAVAPAAPTDLRVTFLGTGAPRPSFDRYGPMSLIEAGNQKILVDPGPGLRERLLEAGSFELITAIDHVLVTHLHFDHTVSLPDLWLTGWLYGRRTPFVVEGPVGTAAMMRHFEQAFAWDTAYRRAVGVPAAGVAIEARDVQPGIVFDREGLVVTAFEVEHMPIDVQTRQRIPFEGQTFGFRFDYHGHSLVLSGDTRPSDNVVAHAQGVDVLVHEVQVPSPDETDEAKLANVSLSVHTEPKDAAAIFARAKPRMAVYSHIIPPDVTEAQLRAVTPYDGPMTVARDLMMITIGDQIVVADRPRAQARSFERSGAIR